MSPTGITLEITPIRSASDWERILPTIDAFLDTIPAENPWQFSEHVRQLHLLFWPESTIWLMALHEDNGTPMAIMLLKEEISRGRLGAVKVLRSIDAMVSETNSLWCHPARRAAASRAFADNLNVISDKTKASIMHLYRQSDDGGRSLSESLNSSGVFHQLSRFTTAMRITLPDGLVDYHKQVGMKKIRDIERRVRKMAREVESEPTFWMKQGNLLNDPGFGEDWRRYEELRLKSWQMAATSSSGKADPSTVTEYTRAMAKVWSQKGILEVAGYEVGGMLVASHLNILGDERTWMVLMNHDPDWRHHGVGMQILHRMLEAVHQRGGRVLELGGEATDWKAGWANAESPVHKMTIPLPTFRGRLWAMGLSLRERMKGGTRPSEAT